MPKDLSADTVREADRQTSPPHTHEYICVDLGICKWFLKIDR